MSEQNKVVFAEAGVKICFWSQGRWSEQNLYGPLLEGPSCKEQRATAALAQPLSRFCRDPLYRGA